LSVPCAIWLGGDNPNCGLICKGCRNNVSDWIKRPTMPRIFRNVGGIHNSMPWRKRREPISARFYLSVTKPWIFATRSLNKKFYKHLRDVSWDKRFKYVYFGN